MKTKIEIRFAYHPLRIGEITWAADEDFTELNKLNRIHLIDTKAVDIDRMGGLSTTSRILLSAVAGAAWQYIFDNTDIDESRYPDLIIEINRHKEHVPMETLLYDLDHTGFATDRLIDNGIETLGELVELLQQPKKFCSIRGFGWGKVRELYHILNTLDLDDKVPPEISTKEKFEKNEIQFQKGGIIMIYIASDLHLIKYKDGLIYINQEALDRVHEWPELTDQDQLIYLGDLMDEEIDPYNTYYETFIWNIIRTKIKNGRNIFLRGNNDTLQDKFYNDLGFERVKFATILNVRSKKILLSHTSVNLTGYEDIVNYQIHGHIHRPNTDPNAIPYYHYCKHNINLCTKNCRQYDLTPVQDINLVIEATRNIIYDDSKTEKAGMSQFIQNQVYSYLNNKRV